MTFRKNTTIMAMIFLAGMMMIIPYTADAIVYDTLLVYPDDSPFGDASNLIAHWVFDNRLQGFSGNETNLEVNSGTEEYTDATFGDAILFDGSIMLNATGSESIFDQDRTDDWSFAIRLRSDDTDQANHVFDKGNPLSSNPGYALHWDTTLDRLDYYMRTSTQSLHLSCREIPECNSLADGNFHWYTLSFDTSGRASGAKAFVDGKQIALNVQGDTLTSGSPLNDQEFVVGAKFDNTDHFIGAIDQLIISNKEWTTAEHHAISNMTGVDVRQKLLELEAENASLQSQITSVNGTVQENVAEINDLYDFWDDLRANIITWLAGRP